MSENKKNAKVLKNNTISVNKKSVLPGKSETKNSRKTVKNGKGEKKINEKVRKPNPIPNNKPFPPGVSGNPNGRPPKLLKNIMDQLKANGYTRVGPSQVHDAYEIILNLDSDQLLQYANDNKIPILLRIVATSMLDKKNRMEMLENMLDRAHGKSKQSVGVVLEDNKAPDLSGKSFEELYMLKYGKRPDK